MQEVNEGTQNPLGIRLVDLTHLQLEKLRALETYDLSFVVEFLAGDDLLCEVSFTPALTEFKRYMSLAIIGYRGLPVPSQEVDDVWHAFLLFTREYEAFCREAIGFFVHHSPTKSGLTGTKCSRLTEAYERVFGAAPSQTGLDARCRTCRAVAGEQLHS
jgi:hypothetical protein